MERKLFFSGVKWTIIANWTREIVTAVVTIILARLLGPKDYGTVAIASVYIAFIDMFVGYGFDASLIQNKDMKRIHLDSVFWLILFVSLIGMGGGMMLSGWWAEVNHIPELTPIIWVLSVTIPLKGLIIVQQAVFTRKMDFRTIALRDNWSIFMGAIVGVGMAFHGYGMWALVGQQVTRAVVGLLVLWKVTGWYPRPRFSWDCIKELTGYATAIFVGKMADYIQLYFDALIVGVFFGPVAVGLYRFADRLMNIPLQLFTRAFQMVSFPFFSMMQHDKENLREAVNMCVKVNALISIPSMVGLAALSKPLLSAISPKWLPAVDALRILCIFGTAKSVTLFTGTLLQSLSRPKLQTTLVWALAGANIAGLTLTCIMLKDSPVSDQIVGIAVARTIILALISLPLNMTILIKMADIRWKQIWNAISPPLLASSIMLFTNNSISSSIEGHGYSPFLVLICSALVCAFILIMTLLILDTWFRSRVLIYYSRMSMALQRQWNTRNPKS